MKQTFEGYKVENIDMTYTLDNGDYQVFKELNLTIPSDRITVILGRSGYGKTTLLRLLAGLEKPIAGQIQYYKNGQMIQPKVGMVFQESRLFPWLRVSENITIHAPEDAKTKQLKDQYLKLMGLEKFANAYPAQLSGGMAQKVAIARALAYQPDVLFMDEPFTSLDYFTRLALQDEILRIFREFGIGIIFVTHNVEEALNLAGDLLVLQDKYKVAHFSFGKAGEAGTADMAEKAYKVKQEVLELLK